jgi:hypothetical protein
MGNVLESHSIAVWLKRLILVWTLRRTDPPIFSMSKPLRGKGRFVARPLTMENMPGFVPDVAGACYVPEALAEGFPNISWIVDTLKLSLL